MADYYPLLAKAVSGQADSTPESRRQIYDRARKALLGQLRNMTPPVPQADVDRESDALDDAIRRLEADLSPPPAPPAEPAVADKPSVTDKPAVKEEPVPKTDAPPVVADEPPAPTGLIGPTLPDAGALPPAPPRIDPPPVTAPPQRHTRPAFPPLPPIPPRVPTPKSRAPAPVAAPPETSPAPEGERAEPATLVPEAAEAAAPASSPVDEPQLRLEGVRPIAPQPRAAGGRNLRYGILAVALAAIVGGIAALAISLKDRPEDMMRARPQATAEPGEPSNKIAERIGPGSTTPAAPPRPAPQQASGATPGPAAAPSPAIPVAQRAALLVEAPEEPQKFKTFIGTVVWRLENPPRAPGQPLSQAVRAEADIPEAGLRLSLLFQRNADEAIPAAHIMNLTFTPVAGGAAGNVDEIDLPQMRNEVSPAVDPLFGVPARITPNLFLVGLARDTTLTARNVELLKSRGWLDIPMRLADGRLAKITMEKGPAGDRAIADALASWGQ